MTDTPIKLPACTVIILNEGAQILLLKQPDGQWRLPFIELPADETPVATVQQLAEKQFGLTLIDLECIGFSSAAADVQCVDIQGQKTHPHSFVFVSTYWEGDVQNNAGAEALSFFSIQALPELSEPMSHYLELFLQWLPERGFVFV